MKRYSVISLGLLLSLVLLPSCREKTRSGRPTVAVVESILSGEISEESLILKKLGEKDPMGTIAVIGPTRLAYPLSMRFATCDDFDNVDAHRAPDQLPDFAGETIDMILDEANSDHHFFVASGNTDSLRTVTVRTLLAALDSKCFASAYESEACVDKTVSKAIVFPSPYMSLYGAFDVDTLLRSTNVPVQAVFPLRKAFEKLLKEKGSHLCVAVVTDSVTASDFIHRNLFEELSAELGVEGAECKVFVRDTLGNVLDNMLNVYAEAGGNSPINAILVDDVNVFSYELRNSLETLATRRNPATASIRKLVSPDCKVIDTFEISTEECYRALRSANLFTHEVAYPLVNGYVTVASPDGKAFKLVETRVNVSDKH